MHLSPYKIELGGHAHVPFVTIISVPNGQGRHMTILLDKMIGIVLPTHELTHCPSE